MRALETEWQYGGKTLRSFREYQQHSGQDAQSHETHVDEKSKRRCLSREITTPNLQPEEEATVVPCTPTHAWCLVALVSAAEQDHGSRGQVAILESAHAQFPDIAARIVVEGQSVPASNDRVNLRYNWNTGDLPLLFDDEQELHALPVSRVPALLLVNPSGKLVWRHEGFTTPGELGLLLRSIVGAPGYAEMPFDR